MNETLADAAERYSARDYAGTEAICRALIARQPTDFDALHLLGVALTLTDRPADAVPYLRAAEAIRPGHPPLLVNLGNALLATKDFDGVIAVSRGTDPAALNNLGLAYRGLGRHADAEQAFRRATRSREDFAPAWANLARTLGTLGRPEEALRAGRTALRVAPRDTPVARLADVTNEIGRNFLALGQPAQALAECRAFLRRHPNEQSVVWNMSLCLLLLGHFEEGWRAYEARWGLPEHDPRPDGAEVIDPAAIAGKRVLVLTEQGRGDMIQFIRFAGCLKARGATVIVQAYPDLVDLLATMPSIDHVVSTDAPRPAADLSTPVMSLPLAFGSQPSRVPYLSVPPGRVRAFPPRVGCRIGLAWSGSEESHARSAMPVATLAPLLQLPGFEFHCLQKAIRDADLAWLLSRCPTLIRHAVDDFADTAALMDGMDAVVSIDTAVAHLAGAMGKRLFVLLPFNPDWRWGLNRDDSPWYPTARLFRQPARGAWEPVIESVSRALSGLSTAGLPA